MKNVVKIIFLLLICQGCSNPEIDILKNNSWISIHDARIFEINGDSLIITNYFNHSEGYSFQLKDNEIILDDTLSLGQIDSISENQLILLNDSSFHKTDIFLPIKQSTYQMDTASLKQLLLGSPWEFSINNITCRFDFMDHPLTRPGLNYLWCTQSVDGIEDTDIMDWTVEEYNGTLFLLIMDSRMELFFFQISNIDDSVIFAKTSFDKYINLDNLSLDKELKKVQPHNNDELESIKTKLSGSTWELSDYILLAKNYEIFYRQYQDFVPRQRFRPLPPRNSVKRIYEEFYKDNSINYKFSQEGKAYLIVTDDTIRSGNWILSGDGKYILTDPPSFFNGLKIIDLSDSTLIFEKEEYIDFLDEKNYEKWYIREKLTRKSTLPNTLQTQ